MITPDFAYACQMFDVAYQACQMCSIFNLYSEMNICHVIGLAIFHTDMTNVDV